MRSPYSHHIKSIGHASQPACSAFSFSRLSPDSVPPYLGFDWCWRCWWWSWRFDGVVLMSNNEHPTTTSLFPFCGNAVAVRAVRHSEWQSGSCTRQYQSQRAHAQRHKQRHTTPCANDTSHRVNVQALLIKQYVRAKVWKCAHFSKAFNRQQQQTAVHYTIWFGYCALATKRCRYCCYCGH